MPLAPEVRRLTLINGAVAVAFAALAAWSAFNGDTSGAIFLAVGVVVAVWWSWPTRGPHVDEARALASAGPDDVIVYWRPGCMYCTRLSLSSRFTSWPSNSRRIRVNIWRDPSAANTVRLLRDGFETVPTVVTAQGELIASSVVEMKEVAAGDRDR